MFFFAFLSFQFSLWFMIKPCLLLGTHVLSNLILGTTGARWGQHSPALPGSVLFQEQALRWGFPLRPTLLWLQWRECPCIIGSSPCFRHLPDIEAVLTGVVLTCACRLVKRGRLCWDRSHRSEIKSRHRQHICSHRSQTTTLQSGGCLHWTSSLSLPNKHPSQYRLWNGQLFVSCDVMLERFTCRY